MCLSMVILQKPWKLLLVCHKVLYWVHCCLLIPINDLPKIKKKTYFFPFADDTNIYYESSDILEIQKTVNKDLNKSI